MALFFYLLAIPGLIYSVFSEEKRKMRKKSVSVIAHIRGNEQLWIDSALTGKPDPVLQSCGEPGIKIEVGYWNCEGTARPVSLSHIRHSPATQKRIARAISHLRPGESFVRTKLSYLSVYFRCSQPNSDLIIVADLF